MCGEEETRGMWRIPGIGNANWEMPVETKHRQRFTALNWSFTLNLLPPPTHTHTLYDLTPNLSSYSHPKSFTSLETSLLSSLSSLFPHPTLRLLSPQPLNLGSHPASVILKHTLSYVIWSDLHIITGRTYLTLTLILVLLIDKSLEK